MRLPRKALDGPHRPLRDRIGFWLTIIALGVGLTAGSLALVSASHANQALRDTANLAHRQASIAQDQAREAQDRLTELRDVVCGVYVPIANSPFVEHQSALARTIIAATRHGALRINCPGVH